MTSFIKDEKTQPHIGNVAAQQPLSGVTLVMPTRVIGYSSNSFFYREEAKKSA